MNVTLRTPRMTREQFLDWAERQEARYEFDGYEPVLMTGGLVRHSLICHNIYEALRSRLRGSACTVLGPDAGVATLGAAVRYPDAVVTCSPLPLDEKLLPSPVLVIEVISPTSLRTDRILKPGEYAAVPSVRRYLIVEDTVAGITMLHRSGAEEHWSMDAFGPGETVPLPEVGAELPVDDVYRGVGLPAEEDHGR